MNVAFLERCDVLAGDQRAMIGFIGLGELGGALARNLAESGVDLLVYDADSETVGELVRAGARAAGSIGSVGSGADLVFVCVAEDHQLVEVVQGLLQQMEPGGLIVVHGTYSPDLIEALARKTERAGLEFVDAPLTAGRGRVEDRNAVFFVGGSAAGIEKCRKLLELSARHLILAGPPGAGAKLKLVHQLILCGNAMAAHEGWSLGRAFGVEEAVLREMIRGGAAQSRMAEQWPRAKPALSEHTTNLWVKDLRLCLSAAGQLGLHLPATEQVERLIARIRGD